VYCGKKKKEEEEKEHGRSVLQGEGKVTAVGAFDGGFEITSTIFGPSRSQLSFDFRLYKHG
jgi:hypothetical protein